MECMYLCNWPQFETLRQQNRFIGNSTAHYCQQNTFYAFYASTIDPNLDHNKFDDHFITLMCKHTQIKHVQTFVLEFFILILAINQQRTLSDQIIHETPRNEI